MADNKIKKVVLAYSGGLDTSIIIPWLKENYDNCEVIAVSGNVGQADELEGLEEKAIATGASKLYIEDLNKEFVEEVKNDFQIWPGIELDVLSNSTNKNGNRKNTHPLRNSRNGIRLPVRLCVRL